jgi:hypothetical protein
MALWHLRDIRGLSGETHAGGNAEETLRSSRKSTSLFNRDHHAKHFAPWSMKTRPEFSAVIVVEERETPSGAAGYPVRPRRRYGAEEAHRPPRCIRRVFWNEDPLIFRVANK